MENAWATEDLVKNAQGVAEAAYSGIPQYVTAHSRPSLVILTADQFESLNRLVLKKNIEFSDFLVSRPKGDIFPDDYKSPEIAPREADL